MDNLPKNTNLIPPNPQIEVNSLRPFTQFCLSIGAIPSSYKTALTYEEQLLWLCDFLENTVIPTVNQNGLAVSELQELYEELRNYVDNYFTNLDVHEEINNKLDEMAENGYLTELMQPYFNNLVNSLATETTNRQSTDNDLQNQINVEKARIDNITTLEEGSTTGDAELIDGRVSSDAVNYNSLGNNIRESINKLRYNSYFYADIDKIEGTYINENGEQEEYTPSNNTVDYSLSSSKYIAVTPYSLIYFYKLLEKTSSSNRRSIAFYDENKNFVSSINYHDDSFNNDLVVIEVPENSAFMRCSLHNTFNKGSLTITNTTEYFSKILKNKGRGVLKLVDNLLLENYDYNYNNLTPNTIYVNKHFYTGDTLENVQNAPTKNKNWNGVIVCLSGGIADSIYNADLQSQIIQLAFDTTLSQTSYPRMYFRMCWGVSPNTYWTKWVQLDNSISSENLLFTIINQDTFEQDPNDNYSSDYINYNNGEVVDFSAYGNSYLASKFYEVKPNTYFELLSTNAITSSSNLKGLAFYDKNKDFINGYQYIANSITLDGYIPNNAKYVRITLTDELRNGNWALVYDYSSIEKLSSLVNKEKRIPMLFRGFSHVGCIGDSLASGEWTYKENGVVKFYDDYKFSWGQYMAKITGCIFYNFSEGGLTTRSWFESNKGANLAFDGNHQCEAYICGLGVNDANNLGSNYVGSINDIDLSDYNNNANSYYGNYAKIIQKIQEVSPSAKIWLLTMPRSEHRFIDFNSAVRNIANLFTNVYVIDLYEDYIEEFEGNSFINQNKRDGHYNAVAYEYIAEIMLEALNKFMFNNINEFKFIEMINTDKTYP